MAVFVNKGLNYEVVANAKHPEMTMSSMFKQSRT